MKTKLKRNKSKNLERLQIKNKKENIQKEDFGFKKNLLAVTKTVKINILHKWH